MELSNANLPGIPAVHRGRVTVTDGLRVEDCTLWRMRDGVLVLDETDRWRTDERHRTLGVTVRPPTLLAAGDRGPRLAADARVTDSTPPWPLVAVAGGLLFAGLALWRTKTALRRSA